MLGQHAKKKRLITVVQRIESDVLFERVRQTPQ
jgi:hypothetical protein